MATRLTPAGAEEDDPRGLYGADLARIHHEHFDPTAEAATHEMLRRLAARGVTEGTVVDLGCGSGLLCRKALDAGFDALGVDVSPHMLRLARSHAEGARLRLGSLWDVDLPPCTAVAAVGEVLNYVTPDLTPDLPALGERLESIAAALEPGGILLFDVAGPGRSGPTGSRKGAWDEGGALVFLEETEDADAGQLERTIQTFVPAGALYRRSREVHRLVLYAPEDVSRALERTGFATESLATYGGRTDRRAGWHVFAAERRP